MKDHEQSQNERECIDKIPNVSKVPLEVKVANLKVLFVEHVSHQSQSDDTEGFGEDNGTILDRLLVILIAQLIVHQHDCKCNVNAVRSKLPEDDLLLGRLPV